LKITSKLSIAIALALVLSVVSVSVWAAPDRQGTEGPPRRVVIPITGNQKGLIPVTGGTFNLSILCGCSNDGSITRITDPVKEIGPAPAGFAYLTDALKVELAGPCDFEVSYPYPKDYQDQKGQIYKWNSVLKEWNLVDSTIYGDPKQISTVDKTSTGNIYALIFSLEYPSKVTLCGCNTDDKITSIKDPETKVGTAPVGLNILTDATQVDCKVACNVNICYPYTEEYKLKNGQMYKWDGNISTWSLTKSTISGDPEQICTLNEDSVGGIFTLIGK
jgi:hypothetical protein